MLQTKHDDEEGVDGNYDKDTPAGYIEMLGARSPMSPKKTRKANLPYANAEYRVSTCRYGCREGKIRETRKIIKDEESTNCNRVRRRDIFAQRIQAVQNQKSNLDVL